WTLASGLVRETADTAATLAGQFFHFVGMDGLDIPALQWRAIGGQVVDVAVGSVRTTWNGTALAEMSDRFQAAFKEVLVPWLPASEAMPAPVDVEAVTGGREALRGFSEVLRTAVPLPNAAPWHDAVEDVSRSLWDASGFSRPRPQPQRHIPEAILLAGETGS